MKKEDSWKKVKEEPWWTGGTIEYYDTGGYKNNNYAVWHKENEHFVGWIPKNIVKIGE